MTKEKASNDLGLEKKSLLFDIGRSIRYHQHRRRFFDHLHKTITFISLVSGTATMVSVLAQFPPIWATVAALVVSSASMLDLVIGSPALARQHDELARKFITLQMKVTVGDGESINPYDIYQAERQRIELDEPPILKVLDTKCHNEMLRASGFPQDQQIKIKWYQDLFSQILDIRSASLHA